MKFEELPEKMQKGLLKGTGKTLVISTIIICAFFLGIAALIASFGHNMWVLAIFPLLVAVVGIVNLFIELKAPSNWKEVLRMPTILFQVLLHLNQTRN